MYHTQHGGNIDRYQDTLQQIFQLSDPKEWCGLPVTPPLFHIRTHSPTRSLWCFFWKQHITDSPSMHCHVPDVTSIGHLIGAAPPSQGKPLQDTPSVLSIAHMGPPSMSGHFEPVIHTCSLGRLRFTAHFLLPYAKWRLKGPTSAPAWWDTPEVFLGQPLGFACCWQVQPNLHAGVGNQDKMPIQENM